ncbi:MAG: DNA glycosylase [Clostridia bacterium]|nr:DNA glycosylase [Clostridia bacterium]
MEAKTSFFINKNKINFVQTLMCGQIFSYKQTANGFVVYSQNKKAEVVEFEKFFEIRTKNIDYFKNFFDLETDYKKIKNVLSREKALQDPIKFGSGIRILKQDLLEVIISFVVSANNNIKRITKILFALRENFGENMGDFFAFPTLKKLENITEKQFFALGAGYRSSQLVKLINQLKAVDFESWKEQKTETIKNKLVALSGIGPKVADCILLFGFGKTDVFPVDTWIEKVYNQYFGTCKNRIIIRKELTKKFENLSGYAQQYLFYFQRSFNSK